MKPFCFVLIFFSSLLLYGCDTSQAGNGSEGESTFSGVIADANGDGLKGAKVHFLLLEKNGTSFETIREYLTTTNSTGLWTIDNIQPGDYHVNISHSTMGINYSGVRVSKDSNVKNFGTPELSETIKISGKINGGMSKDSVRVLGTSQVASVDKNGEFILENIYPGTIFIQLNSHEPINILKLYIPQNVESLILPDLDIKTQLDDRSRWTDLFGCSMDCLLVLPSDSALKSFKQSGVIFSLISQSLNYESNVSKVLFNSGNETDKNGIQIKVYENKLDVTLGTPMLFQWFLASDGGFFQLRDLPKGEYSLEVSQALVNVHQWIHDLHVTGEEIELSDSYYGYERSNIFGRIVGLDSGAAVQIWGDTLKSIVDTGSWYQLKNVPSGKQILYITQNGKSWFYPLNIEGVGGLDCPVRDAKLSGISDSYLAPEKYENGIPNWYNGNHFGCIKYFNVDSMNQWMEIPFTNYKY